MPISSVSAIVIRASNRCSLRLLTRQYSAIATTADAKPPEPLNSATISGMPVIGTRLAAIRPISPPTTKPAMMIGQSIPALLTSVVTTAINIPTDATIFPCRAVRGDDSILRPKTKKIAATA